MAITWNLRRLGPPFTGGGMASSVTVTHAWLTDGPHLGEVALSKAVAVSPESGDTLDLEVDLNGHSVTYHADHDRNGAMVIDALGRAVMSCGIRPDLPDLSDPEAVQRWLASDEGPKR